MPKRSVSYSIEADRDGVRIELDETFWNDEADEAGGYLDFKIAQILAEVRAALWVIAYCSKSRQ